MYIPNNLLFTNLFFSVPTPNVSVTAPDTQTVGQSLTLQCEVTTVRGITSGVDIVWSSGGMELNRTNDVSSVMMGNSLVFRDSYNISMLTTSDDDRAFQCRGMINVDPSIFADNDLSLNVTSKCLAMYISVER